MNRPRHIFPRRRQCRPAHPGPTVCLCTFLTISDTELAAPSDTRPFFKITSQKTFPAHSSNPASSRIPSNRPSAAAQGRSCSAARSFRAARVPSLAAGRRRASHGARRRAAAAGPPRPHTRPHTRSIPPAPATRLPPRALRADCASARVRRRPAAAPPPPNPLATAAKGIDRDPRSAILKRGYGLSKDPARAPAEQSLSRPGPWPCGPERPARAHTPAAF